MERRSKYEGCLTWREDNSWYYYDEAKESFELWRRLIGSENVKL